MFYLLLLTRYFYTLLSLIGNFAHELCICKISESLCKFKRLYLLLDIKNVEKHANWMTYLNIDWIIEGTVVVKNKTRSGLFVSHENLLKTVSRPIFHHYFDYSISKNILLLIHQFGIFDSRNSFIFSREILKLLYVIWNVNKSFSYKKILKFCLFLFKARWESLLGQNVC